LCAWQEAIFLSNESEQTFSSPHGPSEMMYMVAFNAKISFVRKDGQILYLAWLQYNENLTCRPLSTQTNPSNLHHGSWREDATSNAQAAEQRRVILA